MRNEYPNVSYWFKSEFGIAHAAVAKAERIRREEVVRRVEEWLTAHPAFRRDSAGKWEWGVW